MGCERYANNQKAEHKPLNIYDLASIKPNP